MPQLNDAAFTVQLLKLFIISLLLQISFGEELCSSGGICVEVFNCPSAIESIKTRKEHDLDRCGWNKFIEKVCCPDVFQNGISTVSSGEETSIWSDDNEINTTKSMTSPSTSIPATSPPPILSSTPSTRVDIRRSEEACSRYGANIPFQVNFHILGGEAAVVGEFPHMAALGYQSADGGSELSWLCGGSLISDRYVLTAAHCVIRIKPIRVLVGVLNITEQSESRKEYDVQNITVHSGYVRRNGSNDIALILTTETIQFGNTVYPACLYQKSDDPIGLIITGWGKLYLGREDRSDTLQKARVAPVALDVCNETYVNRLNRSLTTNQICAGNADPLNPTDSCPGDSGGPMQIAENNMYAVVGIVSFGLTDCGGAAPSVYTRVNQYLPWIESIVWT